RAHRQTPSTVTASTATTPVASTSQDDGSACSTSIAPQTTPAMPPSLSRPGPPPGRGPACGRSAAPRWNSSAVSSPRSGVEGTVTGRTTSMPSRSATRTEGVSAGADHPLGGALLADPQPRRAGARSLVTGPCSHPAAGPAGSLRGRPVEAGLPLLAVRRQALAGVRPTEAEELVGQRGV